MAARARAAIGATRSRERRHVRLRGDLLELVADAHDRLLEVEHPVEVDRGRGEDEVRGHRVEGGLQLVHLLLTIPHGGEKSLEGRVLRERLGQAAHRVRDGVHHLGRAEAPGRDDARPERHATMRERRPVLDDGHPLPFDRAALERQRRAGEDHLGPGVEGGDVGSDRLDGARLGRIHLVDDDDIGHPEVGFTRVVVHLVARPERIRDHHEEVRLVEREVVVTAVPEDDVGLLLGLTEDRLIVDPGVKDPARVEMRLVLLALLDRGLVAVQVRVRREALDALLDQVAVRHRVADHHDLQTLRLEQARKVPGGLALAGPGARGARGDDRLRAPDHRLHGSQQHEVRATCQHAAGLVHHELVGDVAVGEYDPVDLLAREDAFEIGLRDDVDAVRVEGPGELRRVAPVIDPGDLGGRERDDLDRWVVAIDDVEVVEVAPGGAHDDYLRAVHGRPLLRISADADEPVPDHGPGGRPSRPECRRRVKCPARAERTPGSGPVGRARRAAQRHGGGAVTIPPETVSRRVRRVHVTERRTGRVEAAASGPARGCPCAGARTGQGG